MPVTMIFVNVEYFIIIFNKDYNSSTAATMTKKSSTNSTQSASELITKRIADLGDWRGETLSRMRKLIKEADPDVVEEWKWKGTVKL